MVCNNGQLNPIDQCSIPVDGDSYVVSFQVCVAGATNYTQWNGGVNSNDSNPLSDFTDVTIDGAFYIGTQSVDEGYMITSTQNSNEACPIDLITCDVCSEWCSPCGGGCTATTLNNMYQQETNFDVQFGDITGWDTSCITDMSYMFMDSDFNQDISGWDTSNVITMEAMFYGASAFNQPIGSWRPIILINTNSMFKGATSFNQDISEWNFISQDTAEMFSGATSFNQPLGGWNDSVGDVTTMNSMFADATSFNQDISGWNIDEVTDMAGMFTGASSFSSANYDLFLISWSQRNVKEGVVLEMNGQTYSSAGKVGRDLLENTYSWTFFSDGGLYDSPVVESSGGQTNAWASQNIKKAQDLKLVPQSAIGSADTSASSNFMTAIWNWITGWFK
jgi:surface protein